ncbi:unnamed protein product [Prorocentrum cordatum]|uniref:Uncharacterized protein n=1 Tax=Prorocentrum cordatum TaxID=2364126 RepID=A0ABN9PG71_9DINO|nr:unnamed protein product [Polarella glacialis]
MLRAPHGTLQALTLGPAPEHPAVLRRAGPGAALGAAGRAQAGPRVAGGRRRPWAAGAAAVLEAVDAWFTWFGTQPYQSAFIVASIKATASDLLAQKGERMARDGKAAGEASAGEAPAAASAGPARGACSFGGAVSWRRTLAFLLYGGLYQGCAQHFSGRAKGGDWEREGYEICCMQLVSASPRGPFLDT